MGLFAAAELSDQSAAPNCFKEGGYQSDAKVKVGNQINGDHQGDALLYGRVLTGRGRIY